MSAHALSAPQLRTEPHDRSIVLRTRGQSHGAITRLVSPDDPQLRGSQISYAHANGYEIVQALKARDVIGDFRAPDVLRFGLTPLYLRYADVVETVERLRDVWLTRAWDKPEYRERAAVT